MNLLTKAGLRMDESKAESTEVAQFDRYEFSLYNANTFSVT